MTEEPQRPANASAKDIRTTSPFRPDQLDSELAAIAMVNEMIKRLGTPSVVNAKYIAFNSIWQTLNHGETNKTGYDCGLRVNLFRYMGEGSVNNGGKYFDAFWSFAMKPKMILQGLNQGQIEEDKPSIFERIGGWFGRGKKNGEKP